VSADLSGRFDRATITRGSSCSGSCVLDAGKTWNEKVALGARRLSAQVKDMVRAGDASGGNRHGLRVTRRVQVPSPAARCQRRRRLLSRTGCGREKRATRSTGSTVIYSTGRQGRHQAVVTTGAAHWPDPGACPRRYAVRPGRVQREVTPPAGRRPHRAGRRRGHTGRRRPVAGPAAGTAWTGDRLPAPLVGHKGGPSDRRRRRPWTTGTDPRRRRRALPRCRRRVPGGRENQTEPDELHAIGDGQATTTFQVEADNAAGQRRRGRWCPVQHGIWPAYAGRLCCGQTNGEWVEITDDTTRGSTGSTELRQVTWTTSTSHRKFSRRCRPKLGPEWYRTRTPPRVRHAGGPRGPVRSVRTVAAP